MQPANNQFIDELIRQLRYLEGVFVAPGIPQKKVNNALAKNGYFGTDPIIGLIDCTVFGSAKDHIMFTSTGMHWHHVGASPNSGSIPYTNFATCFFESAGFFSGVSTGLGSELSQTGSSVTKDALISLLNSIKNLSATLTPSAPPVQQQESNKAELLALAHNMSEAKNWDAAIKAYEDAGEFRMAGLAREQKAQWNRSHN